MNNLRILSRDFEMVAWSLSFIWWSITELFNFPIGTDAVGVGLILLGLNVARLLNGMSTRGFTIMLGILALVWGGLELVNSVLRLPFELPVFATLLIVLGLIVLVRGVQQSRSQRGALS